MSEPRANPPQSVESSIDFVDAMAFWLKLGFISFGGPAGQISMMHQELVERRRWISERRFLHALNYTMLLPGPEAQQLATYVGWLFHGIKGGLVAGLLFILPSFFILSSLAWTYLEYGDAPVVQGVLYGIKPAVTAIVLFAAFRIGKRALRGPVHWFIAAAALLAITLADIPFPYIVFSAALMGLFVGYIKPEIFAERDEHVPGLNAERHASVIDDDSRPQAHLRFSPGRLALILLAGLGIWLLIMGVLTALYGWQSTLTQMGWFFTKAALVTFGGAYAVLPYVFQGGVETYGWLSATQMIDGLALGETTPGPLIMVVTFVGFVGGWTNSVFGADSNLISAVAAATITTLVTFLPSFMFILAGGPFVEATRGNLRFTAPLATITAAVVGVIVNLALFFAFHTLWPTGFSGDFEWPAALLGVLAFVGLTYLHVSVITLILLAGIAGGFIQWLW